MNEPQTLDEVMDQAIVPEQEAVETPAEAVSTEEPQEESYTRIDPKSLSPELQAMHKSLLRDYTKKTQALAKQRKEYEEGFSQPQQQEQPQPIQAEQSAQVPHDGMSVDEYTAFMLSKVEERLTEQEQRMLDDQNQKYLDKAVQEFESIDERLNPESPAGVYDEYMRNAVGGKLDEALNAFTQENGSPIGFDYQAQTEELVEQYEKHMEERANAIATQRTQRAFKSAKRTASTSVTSSQAPSKPVERMSLDEAIDTAFSD